MAGITLLAIVVYARALLPEHTFIADVIFRFFLGQYSLLKEALAHGELPFWNPYISCGTPFLANAQSSLFYPGTYLFALCDFALALKIHVVAHTILGCLLMTLLANELGLNPWPARLAGLIYAFNGFAVLHFQLPVHLQAYTWAPLVVYGLRRALAHLSHRSFVGGVLGLALIFFCGYVPLMVYAVIIAITIAMGTTRGAWGKKVGQLSLLFAVALALAAVQMGPMLQFALESSRSASSGQGWVLAKSLEWGELARMAFYPLWDWHLRFNSDIGITGFYWGYPVLILVALALRDLRTSRLCRILLVLFCFGILLAAGEHGLIYPLLAKYVWPFGWLRYPANALLLANFSIALLAGMGLERLGRRASLWVILACIVDLTLFAQRAYETIESSFYREIPPTATFLQQHTAGARLYMTPPSAARMGRTGNSRYEAYVNFADSIMSNYATVFHLHDVEGGSEFQWERYRRVREEIKNSRFSPWLNIVGARYILSFWPLPGLSSIWKGPSGIQVFENRRALPRAYLVHLSLYAPADESFEGITTGRLDPRKYAVLNDLSANLPPVKASPLVPLSVEELSPNHLRIHVHAAQSGWVVLSDSYDRGWKAREGDKPTPIYRTNYIQQAVAVSAGVTTLDWRYRPEGWNGMILLSLAAAIFLVYFGMFRKADKL